MWIDPDASEEGEEVRPALAGDSSDDELGFGGEVDAYRTVQGSFFESDDELGFDDWYGTARANQGTCRGEAEGVSGTESWNPVAWAIDTSSRTMHVGESFRKVDRDLREESVDDSSGSKPGCWDKTDGSYKLHTAPSGLVSGERSFALTI